MRYIESITDRAESDIKNQTAKAFFNIADWQRIHNNVQVAKTIVDFLLSINVPLADLTEPTIFTVPTVTEINTFLANIESVRSAMCLPEIDGISEVLSNWQEGTGANTPDYMDVNQWESILDYLVTSSAFVIDYQIYCGVAEAGQSRFYQNRFRRIARISDSISPVRVNRTGIGLCGASLTRNNGFRRYA